MSAQKFFRFLTWICPVACNELKIISVRNLPAKLLHNVYSLYTGRKMILHQIVRYRCPSAKRRKVNKALDKAFCLVAVFLSHVHILISDCSYHIYKHAPLLLSLYPEMSYFMVFKTCLMHMQIIKPECDHIVLLVQNESITFFTS